MEGQENIQEILSKQLLLCQFLTALSTLRTGMCAQIYASYSQSAHLSISGSYLILMFLDFLQKIIMFSLDIPLSYSCYVLVPCAVLRVQIKSHWHSLSSPGGHFVCKTFDLFTPFSVGLVYLLYLCFDRISLFKPVTSRPANSERWGSVCVCV